MDIKEVRFLEVLWNAPKIMKNPLKYHNKWFERSGDTFRIHTSFDQSSLFTRDADLVKYVLQTSEKKYHKSAYQTDRLAFYLGNGLLTSSGTYWKKQRKLIQPSFYKKKLNTVANIIKEVAIREIEKIEADKEADIHLITSSLAFKIVAESLFGYACDTQTIDRIQHIMEKVQKDFIFELRFPFLRWWRQVSGKRKHTKNLSLELQSIIGELVEARRLTQGEFDNLLDILLNCTYEGGTKMTTEQLVDEILILFIAGHETTANALAFTLGLLGQNQDVQEKVLKEISAFSTASQSLMGLFEEASFVKQCIDESMRLYPPAYFSDRVAIEDDYYKDLTFKKGEQLLISFFEIHRNSNFWEKSTEFLPDRFEKERVKAYSGNYFPFGGGPRMCVGSNFAMYEMLVVITEIIKRFKVTTVAKEIKYEPLITLRPVDLFLRFEAREC